MAARCFILMRHTTIPSAHRNSALVPMSGEKAYLCTGSALNGNSGKIYR